jgi:hypothetical protein
LCDVAIESFARDPRCFLLSFLIIIEPSSTQFFRVSV